MHHDTGRSRGHARGMDKLQRAGRDFLMRLVAEHRLRGAAPVLRALAQEIEDLAQLDLNPTFFHSK